MKLTIRLFARARDLAGADSIDVELPSGGTVRDARERGPVVATIRRSVREGRIARGIGRERGDGGPRRRVH